MICGMTIFQILWFFMIYAVIGWVIEVAYHAITLGQVINRGFLIGPLCPVYGAGVIMVLSVLDIVGNLFGLETNLGKVSTWELFIVGIIFATLIELIAGFLLDKFFHARWWDYRDRKFNLNGYICLEFSIIWGLAIAFVLRVVHPTFDRFVDKIHGHVAWFVLMIIYAVFIADTVLTVMTILKLNKQLEALQNMEKSIRSLSDGMSEVIAGGTMKAMKQVEEKKEEFNEYKEKKIEEITEKKEARAERKEARKEAFAEKKEARKEAFAEKREARRESYAEMREKQKAAMEKNYAFMREKLRKSRIFGMGRVLNTMPKRSHAYYQGIVEKLREANTRNVDE